MTTERRNHPPFEDENPFETETVLAAPFRGARETELESLKARLLRDQLAGGAQIDSVVPLRRAANEAAALAWLTQFPLLVFPALFEEKATALQLQLNKQARVRSRSKGLIFA